MIFSIALKEFYNNLVSVRFVIGFLLCLLLIPFTMLVSINDYTNQMRAYEIERKQAEEHNKVRVYSALRPEIVKPPEPLSIFSRGISYNVGNTIKILLGEKPFMATGRNSVRENSLLNRFFSVDFSTIIAIIMSLLAFLFTYDSCTRERERGTLKLLLANSVSRSKILLGKVVGVSMTLLPIILFCYIMSALIILFHPLISFSAGEWLRTGILCCASVLFFILFMALGLFISSRLRLSVTSIILCLFVWVTFVFIVPNLSVYLARSFIHTGSRENLQYALDNINSDFDEKCSEYQKQLERPDWYVNWNMRAGEDGYKEVSGGSRSLMEYYREQYQFTEPLRIDYADTKWALQKSYLDRLDKQRTFAERISLISPAEVFKLIASSLCCTDVNSHFRFLESTREYREELIMFFEDEKTFASFEYFTRQPPETFMTADEIVRTRSGGRFQALSEYNEWARLHNGDFSPLWKVDIPGIVWDEVQPLDLSNVPKYQWEPSTITDELKMSFNKLAALALVCILLFYLSFISFTRYDVR
jgi:ABC-type transport system involved in multi-copper enzyme maturation permease subunit